MLVDRFLEDATEVDVDAIRDATGEVLIGGVMEHVEEAGVHSGDSRLRHPAAHAAAAGDRGDRGPHPAPSPRPSTSAGLVNVQYAVKQGQVFVIEANPRASRTVPFVAKATGVPLAKVAARVMLGATLAELRAEGLLSAPVNGGHVAVKEAVLPFNRFPDVDTVLGPEMRSTGEVMGIDATFGLAFAKSQIAAGNRLPAAGTVFLSLADRDKAGRPRGRPAASPTSASRSSPPTGTAALPRGPRRPGRRRWWPSSARRADGRTRRPVDLIEPRARSTWWSTRPGGGARAPTAPTSAGPPPSTRCAASRRCRRPWRPPTAWPSGPRTARGASLQEFHARRRRRPARGWAI